MWLVTKGSRIFLWGGLPGVNASDLSRGLVTSAMLALLVRLGQDFEEFLADSNGLPLMANHFTALRSLIRIIQQWRAVIWDLHRLFPSRHFEV